MECRFGRSGPKFGPSGSCPSPQAYNDPDTSSAGFVDGPDLRGIRDTLLNTPSAGLGQAIELFSVPVVALAPGPARVRLFPGASGGLFDSDFLVVLKGDAAPLSGGEYSRAYVELTIDSGTVSTGPTVTIALTPDRRVQVAFDVAPGANFILETREGLSPQQPWSSVSGGAIANGRYVYETAPTFATRFFRARHAVP